MSTFAVFMYRFEPIQVQPDLFNTWTETPDERMANKKEYFARFFKEKKVELKYRNKVYKINIFFNEGDIIALQIANLHRRGIEKDFVKGQVDDQPSLVILIDNRKDMQRILIQKRQTAFDDVTTVYHILAQSLEAFMSQFGLRIIIARSTESSEFWTLVDEIKSRRGISSIRFNVSYPNLPDIQHKAAAGLSNLAKAIHATNTNVTLNAENDGVLDIDPSNEDIQEMAEASACCGSPIKIREKGTSRYRETGTIKKNIEWPDFDLEIFSRNLFNNGLERVSEFLNQLKRI